MIPIPIIITQSEPIPETCPGCGKEEQMRVVCAHCGHEYEEDDEPETFWQKYRVLILPLSFVFFAATFVIWAMEHKSSYKPYTGSYLEFLGDLFTGLWGLIKDIV